MKKKKVWLIIFTVIIFAIGISIFPSGKSIYGSRSVCYAEAEIDNYYAYRYINWIIQRKWTGGKSNKDSGVDYNDYYRSNY